MFVNKYLCIFVLGLLVCGVLSQQKCSQKEKKIYDGGAYNIVPGSIQPYHVAAVFKIDCKSVWHVIVNACDADNYPDIAISPDLKQVHIRRRVAAPSKAVYNIKYSCVPT